MVTKYEVKALSYQDKVQDKVLELEIDLKKHKEEGVRLKEEGVISNIAEVEKIGFNEEELGKQPPE